MHANIILHPNIEMRPSFFLNKANVYRLSFISDADTNETIYTGGGKKLFF